jgi:uncharacterized membrane protein SpoIIM required for sporulation
MKEARFLQKNMDKWKAYEKQLDRPSDPDALASSFIELTDDLAFARTFYPGSRTTDYLNGLTAGFHQKLYRHRRERSGRLWSFWRYELPFLIGRYHRQLGYAFLIFMAFIGVGALSASGESTFVRLVLGDHYVNQTLENISRGNPFGVYQQDGALWMFFSIAKNNITVAFLAYVLGITASIGTILLLMYNGIMLGAIETFFFQQGVGWDSVWTVFIHGTLEISVTIVAGCAGLVLGSSLLFTGTDSRWDSLRRGSRDAAKIAFGLVPFYLVAAFLESFVTRHYQQMPVGVKVLILLLSLTLVIGYFVVYPIRLHRQVRQVQKDPQAVFPDHNFTPWLNRTLPFEK